MPGGRFLSEMTSRSLSSREQLTLASVHVLVYAETIICGVVICSSGSGDCMFAEIPGGVSFCEADCPEGFCRGFAGDLWGICGEGVAE